MSTASPSPLCFHVDLDDRGHHLVRVRLEVPDDVAGPIRLVMPTWTPGSYLMRDYVHHVQQMAVEDANGTEVTATPDGHTAWLVAADGPVVVSWELYANDHTVRTNHVDDHHALLVAPATFLAVAGVRDREHRVRFAADATVHSMLERDGRDHVAANFDLLVDTAFEVEGQTPFPVEERTIDDIVHRFVWSGHDPAPDLVAVGDAMVALAQATRTLLGTPLPMERYTFLCTSWEGRTAGGLEHRDGSTLMVPVTMDGPEDRLELVTALVAHEYLHLANVKRMLPHELARPSLTEHVHTTSLWVAEGWTHYFDAVLPTRAGLQDVDALLEAMAGRIDRVRDRPGAQLQSVADASWTAWTKLYVRDENSANAGTDYYVHGGLLAWCLDLLIRRHRPGSDGLDDAFRRLWNTFGDTSPLPPTSGYRPEDVVAAVSAAAGVDLSAFFSTHVTGTAPPPIDDLLEVVGLTRTTKVDDDAPPWLGITTATGDGATIASVARWGPAWDAGLTGGDQLLAIDGLKVEDGRLDAALRRHEPGDEVTVTTFCGPRLRTHTVVLGQPRGTSRLEPVAEPTEDQRAAFHHWCGHDLPRPGNTAGPDDDMP